jgi:peptide/nickel transport system substrate-binding protein
LKKLFLIPLTILLVCAFVVTGCSSPASTTSAPNAPAPSATGAPKPGTAAPPTAAAQPQSGGVLKIISRSDLGLIGNPTKGTANITRTLGPAMDFLLRHDSNWDPIPASGLAQSWDISPDGTSITFHLKQGVKFQDGTDFNAAALKYNFETYTSITPYLQKVSSYEVVDPLTLKINLKVFDATFLSELGHGLPGLVISPTAAAKQSTDETMAKDHTIGTGPFTYTSWKQNVNAIFTRWGGYREKGLPYLDGVEWDYVIDPVTSLISFQKGEAQVIMDLTPVDANTLKEKGYQIIVIQTQQPVMPLVPDGANADSPWSNVKVRQALEYAVDKKAIAPSVGYGFYQPANQFALPTDARYNKNLVPREYDPAKAKALLAEGGYPGGFKTQLIAQTGFNQDILVAIQTYLKAVGIDASLNVVDAAKYVSFNQKGWNNGVMIPGIGMTMGVAGFFRYLGIPGGPGGGLVYNSVYRPDGWQAKLDAMGAQPDDKKRAAQMQEMMQILFDQAMVIPLWSAPMLGAQDKTVHDLHMGEGHQMYYDSAHAWLSK